MKTFLRYINILLLITSSKASTLPSKYDLNAVNTVITGSKNEISYRITSTSLSSLKPDVFQLINIDVILKDQKQETLVSANEGIFDRIQNLLFLHKNVHIVGKNYIITADKADVDFNSKSALLEGNIELNLSKINLKAQKCKIFNNLKDFKCYGQIKTGITFNNL